MNAEIIEICDAVVSAINPTLPDGLTAERFYISPAVDLSMTEGYKIYVYPTDYSSNLATRDRDLYGHLVGIRIAKRFTDASGVPSTAWVDECVNFVRFNVVGPIETNTKKLTVESSTGNPENDRVAFARNSEITVYDPEYLKNKIFVSEIIIEFGDYKTFR